MEISLVLRVHYFTCRCKNKEQLTKQRLRVAGWEGGGAQQSEGLLGILTNVSCRHLGKTQRISNNG